MKKFKLFFQRLYYLWTLRQYLVSGEFGARSTGRLDVFLENENVKIVGGTRPNLWRLYVGEKEVLVQELYIHVTPTSAKLHLGIPLTQ